MDKNTLLFQDKGSGRFKDVKIYPNRIEVLKKGTFGGKHTEIVYLKDITGVNRIKGRDVFLRNRPFPISAVRISAVTSLPFRKMR